MDRTGSRGFLMVCLPAVLISIDQFLQTIRSQKGPTSRALTSFRDHLDAATDTNERGGLPSIVKRHHTMEWRKPWDETELTISSHREAPVIRLLASPRDIWILTQLHVSVSPPGLAFRDFEDGRHP